MSKAKLPQRIENEDGSFTVKLLEPIQYGQEERIESLKLLRPKAKHLRKLKLQDLTMDDMLSLAGKLAAQPPSVMDELGVKDLFEVVGVIEHFLDIGETNGSIA